jgi:hypothetical protein
MFKNNHLKYDTRLKLKFHLHTYIKIQIVVEMKCFTYKQGYIKVGI